MKTTFSPDKPGKKPQSGNWVRHKQHADLNNLLVKLVT